METNYQKQVDDMFFYGYQCCMKKHDIANDAPSFPSNDEEDEFLGSLAPRDRPVLGEGHALKDGPSTKSDSHGERT